MTQERDFQAFWSSLARLRGELLHLGESFFPVARAGVTPCEVMLEDSTLGFKLLRYKSETASAAHKAILFVPHIINRPYILDLYSDVSVVKSFCNSSFTVYLIDWGYPDLSHKNLRFTHYARYIDRCASLVFDDDISLLGYCTGGIISLIYASLHVKRVKNLILLATPVDFSNQFDLRILTGKIADVRNTGAFFGNIPGELFNLAGSALLAAYMPFFLAEPEFASEFLTYEAWRDILKRIRWIMDAPAVPGSVCLDFIEGCYRDNLLVKNKLKACGKVVRLDRIRSSILNIIARYDHLVPVESAKALKEVYAGSDYQEILFPSSHVGLTVSLKAHATLWPQVITWLNARTSSLHPAVAHVV